MSIENLIELGEHDISPKFVAEMRNLGFDLRSSWSSWAT